MFWTYFVLYILPLGILAMAGFFYWYLIEEGEL